MKESCLKTVPDDTFIVIRKWQVLFCQSAFGDAGRGRLPLVGAALISFFEYWHNIKVRMNERVSKLNDIRELHGDDRNQDESLLQFHSYQEIEAALMGIAAEDQVRRARKCLCECGVITEYQNPNPRYKFDKTIYYQFHPEVLNDYIDNSYPENRESNPKNRDGSQKNREPYKRNTAKDVLLKKEPKSDLPSEVEKDSDAFQDSTEQPKEKPKKDMSSARPRPPAREDFAGFADPDLALGIWQEWETYKKEQHKFNYKSKDSRSLGIAKLLSYSGGDIGKARAIIYDAMANGYKGFFEYNAKQPAPTPVVQQPHTIEDSYQLSPEMQSRYEAATRWFSDNCHLCSTIRWLSKAEYEKIQNKDADFIGAMWQYRCVASEFGKVVQASLLALNRLDRWDREKYQSVYEWLKMDVSNRIFKKSGE